MKRFLITLIASLFILITNASGWRPGEQQVKIYLNNSEQVQILKELKIDYEPCGPNIVRAYLITKERLQLEAVGLEIITEIKDLNKHFENF